LDSVRREMDLSGESVEAVDSERVIIRSACLKNPRGRGDAHIEVGDPDH